MLMCDRIINMPKGVSKYNQSGWKHKKNSIRKMSKNRVGSTANENNPRWKGDKVSYHALHNWVRTHFKKGKCCELCGKSPKQDKRGHTTLQWSNKDKKYTRERKDWWSLCISCHRIYDFKNKIIHKYKTI